MKKLGILAIGVLLFLGVSCKKDNNSYQPDMSSNGNSGQAAPVKSSTASVLTATTTDLGGLSGTPVVNKVPMITGIGGEYVVKPIPIRNDVNNPYNDPARVKQPRPRNDMQNPFNDPR